MKKIGKIIGVFIIFSIFLSGIAKADASNSNYIIVKALVKQIVYDNTKDKQEEANKSGTTYQQLNIQILEGKHQGEVYTIKNTIDFLEVNKVTLEEGDKILLNITENEKGEITTAHFYDMVREEYTYILLAIFILSLALIGGVKGIKSIINLIITGVMVIEGLLPLMMKGYNPILSTIIIGSGIAILTLLILSGKNKKTLSAILGTLSGMCIAGILAMLFGSAAKVTGLASENAQMLAIVHNHSSLNFKGILFAAIIIGSLGAVMDVSISVASAMSEILDIKPDISKKELIRSGMNIGKDIMGSMANTLILVYVGGALQTLLLFMATNISYRQIINFDTITSEVISALAGSIGLIWTIPITAIITAGLGKGMKGKTGTIGEMLKRKNEKKKKGKK